MGRTGVATLTVLVGVFLLGACGSGPPDDASYTAANQQAFMAACTDSAVDGVFVRDICECTYEKIVESMDVADLAGVEETLRLDTLAALPEVVAGHIADCVVAEADL